MRYPPCIGYLPSRVMARLLRAERLTHLSFQHESATYRLAAIIERLRNEYGWPIVSEERVRPTSDPVGRNARYCVYYLSITGIQMAGKRGHEYAMKVFNWEAERVAARVAPLTTEDKPASQRCLTCRQSITELETGDVSG